MCRAGNESPLDIISGMHVSFQTGSRAERQRDSHRTKRRSMVFTLELLSDDAFTLTDTNDTAITFLDGDSEVEIAEVELLEAVVVLRDFCDSYE